MSVITHTPTNPAFHRASKRSDSGAFARRAVRMLALAARRALPFAIGFALFAALVVTVITVRLWVWVPISRPW